ncbi:hypothetical protein FGO68_gene4146 [Halteria grandinella]|uniref:Uncharacterized protein n=1 Tax=Halteria grandinella TaxID=5974 RepID=A0A8J8SZB3_HALGN|nr:hypothetical protein FGO68_gene4146 [Halteria grandinella]
MNSFNQQTYMPQHQQLFTPHGIGASTQPPQSIFGYPGAQTITFGGMGHLPQQQHSQKASQPSKKRHRDGKSMSDESTSPGLAGSQHGSAAFQPTQHTHKRVCTNKDGHMRLKQYLKDHEESTLSSNTSATNSGTQISLQSLQQHHHSAMQDDYEMGHAHSQHSEDACMVAGRTSLSRNEIEKIQKERMAQQLNLYKQQMHSRANGVNRLDCCNL